LRYVWYKIFISYWFKKNLNRYGFKGHPLKKDFPLLGYCDLYYNDSIQAIKYNPIELAQTLRFFKFENP
jgi:NADH:ubiquinone oxidoreductase subunit C